MEPDDRRRPIEAIVDVTEASVVMAETRADIRRIPEETMEGRRSLEACLSHDLTWVQPVPTRANKATATRGKGASF